MNTRTKLFLLLLTALAVRVGWCWSVPVDEKAMARSLPDQWEYLQIGRHALAGQGFSFFDFRFQQRLYAFRTPGYPAFIAICGGSVRGVQMAQCAIDVSTALATFLLARRWLNERASLLCAVAVGFNPFLVFFCALILTETLFTSLLVWAMVLLVRPVRFTTAGYVMAAVILSFSVLVRPSALGLPVLLGLGATIVANRSLRWLVLGAAASVAITVLALLPWAARNRVTLDKWVWTATNSGFTFYDGFSPTADGSSNQSFVAQMPELLQMNETQRSVYLATKARAWAVANPSASMRLAGRKLARTWSPVPLSSEFGRLRYVLIGSAYSVPLFLAATAAMFHRRISWRAKVFLLLPAIYFSGMQAMSVGSLRYRIPAEPMLVVLAASIFVARRDEVTGTGSESDLIARDF